VLLFVEGVPKAWTSVVFLFNQSKGKVFLDCFNVALKLEPKTSVRNLYLAEDILGLKLEFGAT
jgi:hypothetical protein